MTFSPIILVNSQRQHHIPVTNRGLAYGDGVFETMLYQPSADTSTLGDIALWSYHQDRLLIGLQRLHIHLNLADLQQHLHSTLQVVDQEIANSHVSAAGVCKLIVTRGEGQQRGYMPDQQATPTLITVFSPLDPCAIEQHQVRSEQGIEVHYCEERVSTSPTLAGIKSLNQLSYVIASGERASLTAQEGLMLDHQGRVIEATARNLFLVKNNLLMTPLLNSGGVAGVMRRWVMESAHTMGLVVKEMDIYPDELFDADEIFLTNSISGLWPVIACQQQRWSVGSTTRHLQERLRHFYQQASTTSFRSLSGDAKGCNN